MEITRAVEDHLQGIMEIERESFSTPWSESSVRFELESPQAICLTALEEGQVLGFALLHAIGDEGELFNIAVRSGRRGGGVGAALLDRLLREAADRGVRKIFLEVRRSNAAAMGLYRSRGFAVCGVRRNYYDAPREDAMLMDIDLSPGRECEVTE